VGFVQPTSVLDPIQVRAVLRRRLEELLGGSRLTASGIARLSQRLLVRQFSPGEEVIKQGVCGDWMAVVASGQIAVFAALPDGLTGLTGREQPVVLLLPGSTFGEAMLADGRPSGSTLRAVTGAEICILRRSDYLSIATERRSRPPRQYRSLWLVPAAAVCLLAVVLAFWLGWERVAANLEARAAATEPHAAPLLSEQVQILAPTNGDLVQQGTEVTVRAAIGQAGLEQADLQIDGQRQGLQANVQGETVPWLLEWDWRGGNEGTHLLQVITRRSDGGWLASAPITVTLVPGGILAFTSNRDGAHAVYTLSSDGRNLQRWTAGPGEGRQPAWGGEGSLLYVAGAETSQAVVRKLAGIADKGSDLFVGRDPAWAPEGDRLAFAATIEDVSQVFVAGSDGGNPTQVTREEVYAGQPSWAPDGKRLAYVAERDKNWDIWLLDLELERVQRLTQDPAMDWAPAWSPDGTRLAFVSDRGGSHQIYSQRSDGTDLRRLTDIPQGAESPVWSPSGFWLAYVAYGGEGAGVNAREIYLMRADGRDQVRLTHNAFDDSQPAWSTGP